MIKLEQNCQIDCSDVKCEQSSFHQKEDHQLLHRPLRRSRVNFPKYYYCGIQQGKGKWTYREQKIYTSFLFNNFEDMSIRSKRKSQKVFREMSQKIGTRTADQCRSHHQKVIKCHKTLEGAIKYYSQQVFARHEKAKNFYQVESRSPNCFRITINTHQIARYKPYH